MGAQLKSTVTLLHLSNVFVSQFIGDLENADTEKNYKTVFQHLLKITGAQPELILVDSHPDYASTTLGNEIAVHTDLIVQKIQHHRAHFAAVLTENNLMDTEKPILGVIWDGVGLGDDGASWGGEFFSWDGEEMSRVQQLSYFPLLLGDKMAREPRLCAFALSNEPDRKILASRFTTQEWKVYASALKTETTRTSSMGRVFDAVAAWCGLCDKVSYEGEAALLLEEAANVFFRTNEEYFETYPLSYSNGQVDTLALIKEVINDVVAGINKQKVAARFHCTLVKLIEEVALENQIHSLAFSGGVFQNALLVSLIEKRLSNTFKLYFHQQLSPNDECISFGQLAYWSMLNRKNSTVNSQRKLQYVDSE
jgi:hydrogenase maturation protein HypF